jgi:hypothetical protein
MCRPAHIARLVVTVVVDAVDRVLRRWTPANVRQECLVRTEPFIADSNAASAVRRILSVFRIQAPRLHGLPAQVLRRDLALSRITVDYAGWDTVASRRCQFVPQAAAAPRRILGVEQRTRLNASRVAAVAHAQPIGRIGLAGYRPASESLASQLDRMMPVGTAATSRWRLGIEQGASLHRPRGAAVAATYPSARLLGWASDSPTAKQASSQISRSRSAHRVSIQAI